MIANLPPIKNAFFLLVLVSTGGLIPLQKVSAEPRCEQPAATLESSNGLVEWRANREQAWANATLGQSFCIGDTLLIKQERAALRLANNTLVRLKEKSRITLLPEKKSFWVELKEGAAHFLSRTPRAFTVKAPYMNAAVDGTEFVVTANKAHNRVAVLEGQVRASNAYGEAVLTQGMQTHCKQGEAPQAPVKIRLQDSAEWVLYYPPLLMEQNVPADVQTLIEAHKLAEAERQLAKLPQDSHLLTYRAFLALASGHSWKASTLLSEAKALSPQTAEQKALQVLITLVKGDKEEALSLNTGLIEEHPANSSALLAHSYALQANTRIEEAFDIANNLRTSHPNNPNVQARFIELSLSLGQTRKAKQQLNEVLRQHPNNSRLLTLAGFVELNQLSSKNALKYFEQAIRLNSEDSLSQLGKALALIQRGEIEQGRRAMELAVLLDPTSALLRSYLGKTYFAQQHNDWSATQYQLAKTLDPNDPTPWYYEAHLKLKQNKPVEALRLINTAIEKNDNRAVYRSRMLLDSDAAARSANQAGIYQALGFHELAQNTAAMAVSENPTDFAAHQALTLAYSEDPRAHRVRADEALMTKILQPIGAKALTIGTGTIGVQSLPWLSPSQVGMNEYSRLFTQKGLSGQVSTFGGTQATKGYQWQMQNIASDTSVDFGQYHFETEGFRTNNHLKEHISEINFHHQATDRFKYFVQHSERSQDSGDLVHGIESEAFDEGLRNEKDWVTNEAGGKFKFSQRSTFLAHGGQYKRKNSRAYFEPTLASTVSSEDTDERHILEAMVIRSNERFYYSIGTQLLEYNFTQTITKSFQDRSFEQRSVFINFQSELTKIKYFFELGYSQQNLKFEEFLAEEGSPEMKFSLSYTPLNGLKLQLAHWELMASQNAYFGNLRSSQSLVSKTPSANGFFRPTIGNSVKLSLHAKDRTTSLLLQKLDYKEADVNPNLNMIYFRDGVSERIHFSHHHTFASNLAIRFESSFSEIHQPRPTSIHSHENYTNTIEAIIPIGQYFTISPSANLIKQALRFSDSKTTKPGLKNIGIELECFVAKYHTKIELTIQNLLNKNSSLYQGHDQNAYDVTNPVLPPVPYQRSLSLKVSKLIQP